MAWKKDMTPAERAAYNTYMARYMTDRYHRRRAAAVEQLGGRCVDCGSEDTLELDHADRGAKSFDIGQVLSTGSEAKVQAELVKCVLRCSACHRAKTAAELGWGQHGGWSMYHRHKCRCDVCVAAHGPGRKRKTDQPPGVS